MSLADSFCCAWHVAGCCCVVGIWVWSLCAWALLEAGREDKDGQGIAYAGRSVQRLAQGDFHCPACAVIIDTHSHALYTFLGFEIQTVKLCPVTLWAGHAACLC